MVHLDADIIQNQSDLCSEHRLHELLAHDNNCASWRGWCSLCCPLVDRLTQFVATLQNKPPNEEKRLEFKQFVLSLGRKEET